MIPTPTGHSIILQHYCLMKLQAGKGHVRLLADDSRPMAIGILAVVEQSLQLLEQACRAWHLSHMIARGQYVVSMVSLKPAKRSFKSSQDHMLLKCCSHAAHMQK